MGTQVKCVLTESSRLYSIITYPGQRYCFQPIH